MSGKFSYFRHDVDTDDDPKMRQFALLLGRRSKEAYHYFFRMIELCAKISNDGQTEFKIHHQTLRLKWETTTSNVSEVCKLLTQSALIVCDDHANHVVCHIPNLPKYLGSYVLKESKGKQRKEKENKLVMVDDKNSVHEVTKITSPLSVLFSHMPEVQTWLDNGSHDTHKIILAKYSKQILEAEVLDMYVWANRNDVKAEAWMYKRLLSKNIDSKAPGRAHKSFTRKGHGVEPTSLNPTGDPYLQEAIDGGLVG